METSDFSFSLHAGARDMAEAINRGCDCRSLDPERLRRQLEAEPSLLGLAAEIGRSRPQLFSATAVFIAPATLAAMADLIGAVESVLTLPACQAIALDRAPPIARIALGPKSVFMGFGLPPGRSRPAAHRDQHPTWGFWVVKLVFLLIAAYLIALLPRIKAGIAAGITVGLLAALITLHFVLMTTQLMWLQLMVPASLLLLGHLLLTV